MSDPLRIIFAGTPDFAARHLKALLLSKHKILGVLTKPDSPNGRGNKLVPNSVKTLAEQHKLKVFQPKSLRTGEVSKLIADLNADVIVAVAYGLIFPKTVLSTPDLGCINVHASLLPRWRGAAPIQRSLLAGDNETGITVIQMDSGLDSGDMLYKSVCPIEATDTSASLYEKLAELGPTALLTTLQNLQKGTAKYEVQDETKVIYAKKLSKEEARLNWCLSAEQLERRIRAFNPWPISYFIIDKNPVKVWKADVLLEEERVDPGIIIRTNKDGIQVATSSGILNLSCLQLSGKKPMSARDLLNARRNWCIPGNQL